MTKTIFHPGKAVTTAWLNKSQYLGPSNPGVVFVPNPIEDWEYPLLTASQLNLLDVRQYFVGTSTNQSIDGVKTFTSIPEAPTSSALTGNQLINVTRLNTELATVQGQINAVNTNLTTNYVSLAGNQSITGTKTFTGIKVPLLPTSADAPVSKQYYEDNTVDLNRVQSITPAKTFLDIRVPLTPTLDSNPVSKKFFEDNGVQLAGTQTITGTKTFNNLLVPNPTALLQAVNKQTLDAAIAGLTPINRSANHIRFGNLQFVWGQTQIFGNWGAGGVLGTGSSNISTYAPSAVPFTSILSYTSAVDRLVAHQILVSLTTVEFFADALASAPQPNDGTFSWLIIGLT